ncbi:hypothetical protein [Methylomonas lenta]|nr:hypothetical protein [Methylomonas lenta]
MKFKLQKYAELDLGAVFETLCDTMLSFSDSILNSRCILISKACS